MLSFLVILTAFSRLCLISMGEDRKVNYTVGQASALKILELKSKGLTALEW